MLETPTAQAPSWQVAAKLKLVRLQSESTAAAETFKAIEAETHTLNSRLNELRPMLKAAEDARGVLCQIPHLPPDDSRLVKVNAAVAAIRAEIDATTSALEDARLRYVTAKDGYNIHQRLTYDAKRALQAAGVDGVH